MRGTIAAIVAACFCLSPPAASGALPIAPDTAGVRDPTPLSCSVSALQPTRPSHECPPIRLNDPFIAVGVRPLLLSLAR